MRALVRVVSSFGAPSRHPARPRWRPLALAWLTLVVAACDAGSAVEEPTPQLATVEAALVGPPSIHDQCKAVVTCINNLCVTLGTKPNGTPCDDAEACSYGDACHAGLCTGTAYSCAGDACRTSTCDGAGGCDVVARPDGSDCGASCGADCYCGQCLSGACGAVEVAGAASGSGSVFPVDLEVQAGALYASNDVFDADGFRGTVSIVRVVDGVATELATDLGPLTSSAIDGSNLYWSEVDRIARIPLAGGPTTVLVPPGTVPAEVELADYIAVDAGHIYFTSSSLGSISSVTLDGADLTTLAVVGWPGDLRSDGSDLFWLDEPAGLVMRMPVGGGTPTAIFAGPAGPWAIALDAGHVYWTNPLEGTVMRVGKDGSGAQTLASGQAQPSSITVTATTVYWSDYAGNDSRVFKVPSAGGAVVSIPSPTVDQGIVGLTHDSACVFWSSYGGELHRAPQ
ncbi:MAG: hypothetical protein U1F43_23305 [Myxococcota bacterium]